MPPVHIPRPGKPSVGQSDRWDWQQAIINFMVATGQPEEVFWTLTPRQTHRSIKAAEQIRSREDQSRRWHTWHAAALPNAKKFPSFKEFVPAPQVEAPAPSRAPQPAETQIAVLMGIFDKGRQRRAAKA